MENRMNGVLVLAIILVSNLAVGLYIYFGVQKLRARKKPIQVPTKEKLELDEEEWADDAEDSSYGDMVPDILREDEEEDE